VISIKKNGIQFATCTVSTSGVGVFSSNETLLSAGDRVTFVFPVTQDNTWAGIVLTITGARGT
jgi:hypothetical protein